MHARKLPAAVPAIIKIYNNLMVMVETYRNAVVQTKLGLDKVEAMLNTQHFATIAATRTVADSDIDPRGTANILVALFAPQQEIETNSPKFSAILESLIRSVSEISKAPRNEIILVTEKPLSSSNMKRAQTRSREADVRIDQYAHDLFALVTPRHSTNPEFRIATQKEVDKLLIECNTSTANFPFLRAGSAPDPIAIWYGLRPGMVIYEVGSSETAGEVTRYRKCV